MKKTIFLFAMAFVAANCSDNKNVSPADTLKKDTPAKSDSANNTFFPVTDFLKGQINLFDILPVTILQVTTAGNKIDSVYLSKEKVKPLLAPFTKDFIDKNNLSAFFKETKFNDQSTDAITLTYDPKSPLPDSFALRHWNVYVNPDKGTVKRVYMVKQLKENGIPYTQQLTWQTDKWAKIVTIKNKPGETTSLVSEIKWVWGFDE
jgi:hypothetical protein